MTTVRPFTCDDLFTYNDVNTDVFTATFNLHFYLSYLSRWPEYFSVATAPDDIAKRLSLLLNVSTK